MPAIYTHQIICDQEDLIKISLYNWTQDEDGRVRTTVGGKTTRIHQLILPHAELIDHINGNHLDVRKVNLREATVLQNAYNRGKTSANTSGFKGVFRRKDLVSRPWLAKITVEKKQINLGRYAFKIEAARKYDCAALELHGEFACINFEKADYVKLPSGKFEYRQTDSEY